MIAQDRAAAERRGREAQDLLPDDPGPWITPDDVEPDDDHDRLAGGILRNDLSWTLDLDDPHRRLPEAQPAHA